jgi:nitrous oxidase accessory protein NosD
MIKLEKKIGSTTLIIALIVTTILALPVDAQTTRQIISIKADGNVDPASASIQRNGNIYTFTDNINSEIRVEKEGITIDGAGYTLMGPYNGSQTLWIIGEGPNQTPTGNTELWSIGIDTVTDSINDVTIKNLNVKNFSIGMYIWTAHNLVTGNAVSNCIVGILLSGNNNTFTQNYFADNKNGVYFGSNEPGNIPVGVLISDNCFVNNFRQFSGCVCENFNSTEEVHTWDNGERGNFWSDYTGTDNNKDGIGDTPYIIDLLNQDRFPLMQNQIVLPTLAPKQQPVESLIAIAAIAVVVVIIVAVVILTLRRKITQTAK